MALIVTSTLNTSLLIKVYWDTIIMAEKRTKPESYRFCAGSTLPRWHVPAGVLRWCQTESPIRNTRGLRLSYRTATKFGARSFAVAAPSEWNRLLLHIRSKPRSSAIALMGALVMTLLCCGALEIVCVLLLLLKWSVRIQFDRQLELLFKANEYKYCHTLKWVWFSSAVVSPQHKCQSRCLTLDSSDVNTLHCVDIHLPDEQRPRHCCVHIDHNVETLHLRSSTTRHLQRSYISIM